jgi:spoIIIJ-associated protein
VTDREGQLIDSFQIFLKRMLQNKHPLEKIEIEVDCDGYLEASAQDLRELAEKLKNATLEKGQATYVRALPPRDRKVVHRYLSDDTRVRSQSVGEGFLKKVKISLVRSGIPAGATEDLSP